MKNKITKFSLQLILICAIIAGSLVGSTGAFADFKGPFNLPSGWSNVGPLLHYSSGCYYFYQDAYLWSDNDDLIWVDWVRQWGGWASSPDSIWCLAYLWTSDDPYNYDIVYGFGAVPIDEGRDITVQVDTYYNVPSGEYLWYEQYSYVYCPYFWNPTDGWIVTP